ncbi:MAG: archaeosine biosynthesis radical SAM protein RaSEA [Promethearchaeota archaeon]
MPQRRNTLLASRIFNLRQEYLNKRAPDFQAKIWSSTIETKESIVITIVIPTRGCSWALSESGGCSVCGYVNDSSYNQPIPTQKILDTIDHSLNQVDSEKPIEFKLYNSGSFFDEKDVPQRLRSQIIDLIRNRNEIIKFGVECRPEYLITNQIVVKETKKILEPIKLEIGVGLESSNNTIITDCWNKGFSIEDYKKSVQILRALDVRIKSYIFIKPPFLTEAEAIIDAIKTAHDAVRFGTDVISFNPCNVQNGTLVNLLQKQDRYQPPWLWSVLYIVKIIRQDFPDLEIICEPTAAGKKRGTHNCGKCDTRVSDLISKVINKEQINENLSTICSCFLTWKLLVETPIEVFRSRNLSKLRQLNPLNE